MDRRLDPRWVHGPPTDPPVFECSDEVGFVSVLMHHSVAMTELCRKDRLLDPRWVHGPTTIVLNPPWVHGPNTNPPCL